LNVEFCGRALRGGSLDGGRASFDIIVGMALRLRDRLAPRRPSSATAGDTRNGVDAPPFTAGVMSGEYGRGVDAENDETWSKITNS